MALQLIEGFDHYTGSNSELAAKGWTANPRPSDSFSMTTGRLAGQALTVTGGDSGQNTIVKALPGTYSTVIIGFALYVDQSALSNPQTFLNLRTSSGDTVATLTVGLAPNSFISVKHSGGSTIATGTTALATETWYYVELKIVVNGSSGSCELQLNGLSEISSTTGNFGSTGIQQVLHSLVLGQKIDDMYVCDDSGSIHNDFLGDQRVETQFPNADGSNTDWTPNTGSTHYTQVDDNPPDGDTSYVTSSTAGDRDTYGINSLSSLVGDVNGVQVNIYARKDDAAAKTIAPVIYMGGTNYDGTETGGLSTSYLYYSQIYEQDPTSTDWTIASVNAAEFGVKEVS